jgi:hypothetical protein
MLCWVLFVGLVSVESRRQAPTATHGHAIWSGENTCLDGKQDGDETDIDCGGEHCHACLKGKCLSNKDCASGVCKQTKMPKALDVGPFGLTSGPDAVAAVGKCVEFTHHPTSFPTAAPSTSPTKAPTQGPTFSPTKYVWETLAEKDSGNGGSADAQASIIAQTTALEDMKKRLDTGAEVADAVANIADYFSHQVRSLTNGCFLGHGC